MHSYLFDTEAIRVAIIVGVIVTTLFYERFQLTSGGAIVPGYLALFLPRPAFVVMALVMSYLTYFIVNRLIARRWIVYGRRKYEVEILTSLALVSVSFTAAHFAVARDPHFIALYGIGFVIPAVIAHDIFRQGVRKTYMAVFVNIGIISLVVYLFSSLNQIAPWYGGPNQPELPVGDYGYPLELLLPAIIVSVVAGMIVFQRLSLRTGGFVVGAYLALVLLRPLDLLFTVAVSVAAYVIVTRYVMHYLLIFGRRKVSAMILVAAILAWGLEIAIVTLTEERFIPWRGFHVITLMVPALIANDAQRQGLYRTLWGAGLTAVTVFSSINLLAAGLLYLGYL